LRLSVGCDKIKLTNQALWGIVMIIIAIICTILGGALGAFLEPVSFSVSIPIAIMGGFILRAIKDKKD
jgi:hypothetical protein